MPKRDDDKPPGLTMLAEAVQASAQQPRRRRSWTGELPALARRWGGIPLTVGGAIGIFAGLMKLFTFGAELEDRVAKKVATMVEVHDSTMKAHRPQLDRVENLHQRTYDQLLDLRAQVRQLQQKITELEAPARRRRR